MDRDEELVGLITSSQRMLFSYIRTLVGPGGDVDDILQEVSLILWRRRDEYRGEGRFLSWACHVAYLQVLFHAKKKRRDRHVYYEADVLADLGEILAEKADQLDDRFEALRQCLAKLPSKHRELISLRYREGGSLRGVADELGRPADSIKVTLHRIRHSLADCIARTLRGDARA